MIHWDALTTLAGGVGLFLLGMNMMSDGSRLAAGSFAGAHIARGPIHAVAGSGLGRAGHGAGAVVQRGHGGHHRIRESRFAALAAGCHPRSGCVAAPATQLALFRGHDSDAGVPRFLNHTLTKVPVLATEALGRELHRLGHLAEGLLRQDAPVDPSGALELAQLDLTNGALTVAHSELKAHGLAEAAAGRLSLVELVARLHRTAALRDAASHMAKASRLNCPLHWQSDLCANRP